MEPKDSNTQTSKSRGVVAWIKNHPWWFGGSVVFVLFALFNLPWILDVVSYAPAIDEEVKARGNRFWGRITPDGPTDIGFIGTLVAVISVFVGLVWLARVLTAKVKPENKSAVQAGCYLASALAVLILFSAASGGRGRVTNWGVTTYAAVPAFQVTSLQQATCTEGTRIEEDRGSVYHWLRKKPVLSWLARPADPAWVEMDFLQVSAIGPDLTGLTPRQYISSLVVTQNPETGARIPPTLWVTLHVPQVQVLSFMVVDKSLKDLPVLQQLQTRSAKAREVFARCDGYTHVTNSSGGGFVTRFNNAALKFFNADGDLKQEVRDRLTTMRLNELRDPNFKVSQGKSTYQLARENFERVECERVRSYVAISLQENDIETPVGCSMVWGETTRPAGPHLPATDNQLPVFLNAPGE